MNWFTKKELFDTLKNFLENQNEGEKEEILTEIAQKQKSSTPT